MKMVDVTLHIEENTSKVQREDFRDYLLNMEGVLAASFNDSKPHLITLEYNPDEVNSSDFVAAAKTKGFRAVLIGL